MFTPVKRNGCRNFLAFGHNPLIRVGDSSFHNEMTIKHLKKAMKGGE